MDFVQTAARVRPRYAVPFASMTCFLHPETAVRNAEVVLPGELVAAAADQPTGGAVVQVMAPGDSWDEAEGFTLSETDPYEGFTEKVAQLQEEVRPRIEAQRAEEASHPLTFDRFGQYFGGFVRALPPGTTRLFKGSVVFAAPPGSEAPYWVVDLRRRQVRQADAPPGDWASIVTVPPGVLADAMDKKIVNFVHISMRIAVELNDGGAHTDFLFWGVLTVWELGYLPLRQLPLAGSLASRGPAVASCWAVRGGSWPERARASSAWPDRSCRPDRSDAADRLGEGIRGTRKG